MESYDSAALDKKLGLLLNSKKSFSSTELSIRACGQNIAKQPLALHTVLHENGQNRLKIIHFHKKKVLTND